MHELEKKEIISKEDKLQIALVGNPNVGKSVLFGLLTGKYVTVSNYPGTTVEVSRGKFLGPSGTVAVVDTPGANSLISQSEDERVARDILLEDDQMKVIQVMDSKNIQRGLLITTQIAEIGLPMAVSLNMWDETLDRGMSVDTTKLQETLGVPITKTIATQRYGVNALRNSISSVEVPNLIVDYGDVIEEGIEKIEKLLPEGLAKKKRGIAIMLLSTDEDLEEALELEQEVLEKIHSIRDIMQHRYVHPLSYMITRKRNDYVNGLLEGIVTYKKGESGVGQVWRNIFFFAIMPPDIVFYWLQDNGLVFIYCIKVCRDW